MEDVKQRKEDSRRKKDINNTKIKYLKVIDKVYEIKKVSFYYMEIEAEQTDLTVDDVPEDETWDLEEFKNYKVKLINGSGMGEIVEFEKFRNKRQ